MTDRFTAEVRIKKGPKGFVQSRRTFFTGEGSVRLRIAQERKDGSRWVSRIRATVDVTVNEDGTVSLDVKEADRLQRSTPEERMRALIQVLAYGVNGLQAGHIAPWEVVPDGDDPAAWAVEDAHSNYVCENEDKGDAEDLCHIVNLADELVTMLASHDAFSSGIRVTDETIYKAWDLLVRETAENLPEALRNPVHQAQTIDLSVGSQLAAYHLFEYTAQLGILRAAGYQRTTLGDAVAEYLHTVYGRPKEDHEDPDDEAKDPR